MWLITLVKSNIPYLHISFLRHDACQWWHGTDKCMFRSPWARPDRCTAREDHLQGHVSQLFSFITEKTNLIFKDLFYISDFLFHIYELSRWPDQIVSRAMAWGPEALHSCNTGGFIVDLRCQITNVTLLLNISSLSLSTRHTQSLDHAWTHRRIFLTHWLKSFLGGPMCKIIWMYIQLLMPVKSLEVIGGHTPLSPRDQSLSNVCGRFRGKKHFGQG